MEHKRRLEEKAALQELLFSPFVGLQLGLFWYSLAFWASGEEAGDTVTQEKKASFKTS